MITVASLEARIAEIEKAMVQLVQNHTVLTGHLTEAKHLLDLAKGVADEVAPASPITEVLDEVAMVADIV